jgi:hypothetical protein
MRRVDPYRIWFFNGTFYLIGYCHTRNEIRVEAEAMAKQYEKGVEWGTSIKL